MQKDSIEALHQYRNPLVQEAGLSSLARATIIIINQNCKWEVWCRDQDETETSESRDQDKTLECRDRADTETWSDGIETRLRSSKQRSSRDWSLGPIQLYNVYPPTHI